MDAKPYASGPIHCTLLRNHLYCFKVSLISDFLKT